MSKPTSKPSASKTNTKISKPSPLPPLVKPRPAPRRRPTVKTPWTIEAASRVYSATAKKHGQIEKDTFAADTMSKAMRNQAKLIKN